MKKALLAGSAFLCDRPWGASRACTKMQPMANGQSRRSILLEVVGGAKERTSVKTKGNIPKD